MNGPQRTGLAQEHILTRIIDFSSQYDVSLWTPEARQRDILRLRTVAKAWKAAADIVERQQLAIELEFGDDDDEGEHWAKRLATGAVTCLRLQCIDSIDAVALNALTGMAELESRAHFATIFEMRGLERLNIVVGKWAHSILLGETLASDGKPIGLLFRAAQQGFFDRLTSLFIDLGSLSNLTHLVLACPPTLRHLGTTYAWPICLQTVQRPAFGLRALGICSSDTSRPIVEWLLPAATASCILTMEFFGNIVEYKATATRLEQLFFLSMTGLVVVMNAYWPALQILSCVEWKVMLTAPVLKAFPCLRILRIGRATIDGRSASARAVASMMQDMRAGLHLELVRQTAWNEEVVRVIDQACQDRGVVLKWHLPLWQPSQPAIAFRAALLQPFRSDSDIYDLWASCVKHGAVESWEQLRAKSH